MKKKFLLPAIVIILCMLAFAVSAKTVTDGYVAYSYSYYEPYMELFYDDGTDETIYFGPSAGLTSVTIPDGVTEIRDYSFFECSNLTEIILPDSVRSIGAGAFFYCDSLPGITLPSNLTSIGDNAFEHCPSLLSINIPASVNYIGQTVFVNSYRLSSITVDPLNTVYHSDGNCLIETETKTIIQGTATSVIPDDGSVTVIGDCAFSGCEALTDITVPGCITSIGQYAFFECRSLKNVSLGEGLRYIRDYAFCECTSLQGIEIPDTVTELGETVFGECSSLKEAKLSGNMTVIPEYCFYNCASLESLTIPDGVEAITSDAFEGCKSLVTVLIPDSVTAIGSGVFSECESLVSVNLPDWLEEIPGYMFDGCISLTGISLPEGIRSIGDSAFNCCTSLAEITIPENVEEIGAYAFFDCDSLTDIYIPANVSYIAEAAFMDCNALTAITVDENNTSFSGSGSCLVDLNSKSLIFGCKNSIIPDDGSVETIVTNAFYGCDGLESITIPSSVKTIELTAFAFCRSLKNVTFSEGLENIEQGAFYKCKELSALNLPSTIMHVHYDAFAGCSGLETITVSEANEIYHSDGNCLIETGIQKLVLGCINSVIPDDGSVETIGDQAFLECPVTEMTIPDSVKYLEEYAFFCCEDLTDLTIPSSITSIPSYAFGACSSLEKLVIPEGVKSIHPSAFMECTGLKEITFPTSLRRIFYSAFSDSYNLENIYYLGTKSDWDNILIEYFNSYLTEANLFCQAAHVAEGTTGEDESIDWVLFESGTLYISGSGEITSHPWSEYADQTVSVVFSNDITSICDSAFSGFDSLTSVSLPGQLTSVGDLAFSDCTSLAEAEYPGYEEEWEQVSVGDGNESLISVLTFREVHEHAFSEWEAYSETYHVRYCECEYEDYDEHRWDEGTLVVQPGHNYKGYVRFTCLDCGYTEYVLAENRIELSDESSCEFIKTENGIYISGISANTTVSDVKSEFKSYGIEFVREDGTPMADDDLIGTGSKVRIVNSDTSETVDEAVFIIAGDFNDDGLVQSVDALLALKQSVGTVPGTDATLLAGDLDSNGRISSAEALRILKYSVGTISSLK